MIDVAFVMNSHKQLLKIISLKRYNRVNSNLPTGGFKKMKENDIVIVNHGAESDVEKKDIQIKVLQLKRHGRKGGGGKN